MLNCKTIHRTQSFQEQLPLMDFAVQGVVSGDECCPCPATRQTEERVVVFNGSTPPQIITCTGPTDCTCLKVTIFLLGTNV